MILAYVDSHIENLNIQGNALENEGVINLMKAMKINTVYNHLIKSHNKARKIILIKN